MMQKNYNTKVLLRKWIIDEQGSGVLRMKEAMKEWKLLCPEFEENILKVVG